MGRTEHVALLVLAALRVGNVDLDAKIEKCEILNGIQLRVQAADESEATARVNVARDSSELLAQHGQWKGVSCNVVPVKS